jgi:hypothetical protein
VAALAAELADHDPLVHFTVSCSCPACGEANEIAIDLEGLALGRLARRRRALTRTFMPSPPRMAGPRPRRLRFPRSAAPRTGRWSTGRGMNDYFRRADPF